MIDDFDGRVAEMLCVALDQPEAQRAAWLHTLRQDDPALGAAVARLLDLDHKTGLMLDQPMVSLIGGVIPPAPPEAVVARRIGPFRIVRRLGEGGMGSVWLAEREEGGFRQQVALKLIRSGMNSAAVAQHFQRERELLARLHHPAIARLLDGGVDEDGQPWFAMEFVAGTDLHDWMQRRDVDLRARLLLFTQLCRAVAYAHQHLIVHRDIKPSNILVRADGSPCLLDFGIAKLLVDDVGDETPTVTGARFLTRGYAAPEQLSGALVTTATDVFALGIVLLELLTALHYPQLRKSGRAPSQPSLALRMFDAPPAAATPSAQLRGDLDAITARALAEEPERRYATAQALADDIDNYLDGRAVNARPDSLLYRLGKFARRHRAAVAVASVSVVALGVLAAIAFWQAYEKGIEAERARIALQRSESIRALLGSIFLSADPNTGKGADTTVGELLRPALARIERDAGNDPAVAAALMEQLGSSYVSLGEDTLAREALRAALAFNRRANQPSLSIEGVATARLAYYRALEGDSVQALAELRAITTKLREGGTSVRPALALALDLQSHVLFESDQAEAALAVAAEALELWRGLGDAYASDYVHGLVGYSDLAAAAGQDDAALDAATHALAHPLLRNDAAPGLMAAVLGANARALQALGRHAEAEPMMARTVAAFSAVFGEDNGRTYYWRYRHAQVLQSLGRLDEAQAIIDALLARPASSEQPIARVAYAVVGAQIATARHAIDASARVEAALQLACSDAGNAHFCAKARELQSR